MIQASDMVATTGRNTLYLRQMLSLAVNQFDDEVNTTNEREELKKLIVVIKMRRELKKLNPGNKLIQKFLGRMEEHNMFDAKDATQS